MTIISSLVILSLAVRLYSNSTLKRHSSVPLLVLWLDAPPTR